MTGPGQTAIYRLIGWICCAAPLCFGCAHHKNSTSSPSVPLTGSNLGSANNGRAVFTSRCNACHALPTISNYTSNEWSNSLLPSMTAKAGLSSSDTSDLAAYIASVLAASSK